MSAGAKLLAFLCPFIGGGGYLKRAMTENAGFSENQYNNVKRYYADLVLFLLIYVVKSLLEPPEEEEQKHTVTETVFNEKTGLPEYEGYGNEKTKAKTVTVTTGGVEDEATFRYRMYYFATRCYYDEGAFLFPPLTFNELQSLSSFIPAGASAILDLYQMAKEFAGAAVTDESDKDFYVQRNVDAVAKKGTPKAFVHLVRDFPFLRDYRFWTEPIQAAKSYEYQKYVVGRK